MSKSKSNITTALIVDDNDNFRSGFREYLSYQTDLNIVGEAKDGFDALKLIDKLKPDIVFMDISMPQMDGLTAVHLIKEKYPDIKVVIVTIYEKYLLKEVADTLAVNGIVCKSSISDELPRMLKKLDVFVSASVE